MSTVGREVIKAIDRAELEVAFWQRYVDRFTPGERRRLRGGDKRKADYGVIVRPLPPRWEAGTWLKVTPKLEVLIGKTTLRRGVYRTLIIAVRDFRGGRAVDRRLHEDPQTMTTIVPVNDWAADPPEPEKVPHAEVCTLPSTVAARVNYERERLEERAAYEQLPLEIRLSRLQEFADREGVDVTRQLARIEQGIKAAEGKVRRLAEVTSDRAA